MKGTFLDAFKDWYHRNTRKTKQDSKQKCLRCFPKCCENGHMESGFCGTPIQVRIEGLAVPNGVFLRSYGEFEVADSVEQFQVNDKITFEEAKNKERSRAKPTLPWLRGEVAMESNNSNELMVYFNRQMLAWHYGWVGGKAARDTLHHFKVHMFQQVGDELTYLGSVSSPKFSIHARRRKTNKDEMEEEKIAKTTTNAIPKKRPAPDKSPLPRPGAKRTCIEYVLPPTNAVERRNRVLDRLYQLVIQFSSGSDPFMPTNTPGGSSSTLSTSSSSTESTSMNFLFQDEWNTANLDRSQTLSKDDLLKFLTEAAQLPCEKERNEQTSSEVAQHKMGTETVRSTLINKGNFPVHQVEEFIQDVNRISDTILQLSRNNDGFENIYRKWSSSSGMLQLRSQINLEKDLSFEWSPRREDEEYDEENPFNNVENSIFASYRNCFRKMMALALEMLQKDTETMYDILEVAARSGIIMHDAFYPPNPLSAAYMHLQLYGNVDKFQEEDYGSRAGRFRDTDQQKRYARDVLVIKRSMFRRFLLNRILNAQQNSRRKQVIEPPVDPTYDISGIWITTKHVDEDERSLKMTHALNALTGTQNGTFFSKLFLLMFSRLEIRVSSKSLTLTGEKILMGEPRLQVEFGKVQEFRPSVPLPVEPFTAPKNVVGWLSQTKTGKKTVNIVITGPISDLNMNHIGQVREDGRLGREGINPVGPYQQLATAATSSRVTRILVFERFIIAPDSKDKFVMQQEFIHFENPDEVPPLENTEQLEEFLVNRTHSGLTIMHTDVPFMRSFLDPKDTEYLLDALVNV